MKNIQASFDGTYFSVTFDCSCGRGQRASVPESGLTVPYEHDCPYGCGETHRICFYSNIVKVDGESLPYEDLSVEAVA